MTRRCLLTIIQSFPCHNSQRLFSRKLYLKKVVYAILFLCLFISTINYPVTLLSTVVELSIEAGSSFINVLVDPEIGFSVAIFPTILAHSLEELSISVLCYFYSV